ncbi:hypothetical protein ACIQ9Q_24955 [Streptomyces sp. NPDC094438]
MGDNDAHAFPDRLVIHTTPMADGHHVPLHLVGELDYATVPVL